MMTSSVATMEMQAMTEPQVSAQAIPSWLRDAIVNENQPLTELEQARLDIVKSRTREMRRKPVDSAEERDKVAHYRQLTIDKAIELAIREEGADADGQYESIKAYIEADFQEVRAQVDEKIDSNPFYRARRAVGEFMDRGGKVARIAKNIGATAIGVTLGGAIGGVAGAAAGSGAVRAGLEMSKHKFDSLESRAKVSVDLQEDAEQEATRGDSNSVERAEWLLNVANRIYENYNKELEDDISNQREKFHKAIGKAARSGAKAAAVTLVVGSVFSTISVAHADGGSGDIQPVADTVSASAEVSDTSHIVSEVGDASSTQLLPDAFDSSPSDSDIAPQVEKEYSGGLAETGAEGEVYEFSYGAAPEHLLQEVVSEQFGVDLNGRDAYLLINHLMEQTNGNIFEGVETKWHVKGSDVWIMDPGGSTSGLTPEGLEVAREFLGADGDVDGSGPEVSPGESEPEVSPPDGPPEDSIRPPIDGEGTDSIRPPIDGDDTSITPPVGDNGEGIKPPIDGSGTESIQTPVDQSNTEGIKPPLEPSDINPPIDKDSSGGIQPDIEGVSYLEESLGIGEVDFNGESFQFGYGTSVEGLLQEVVSEQLGVNVEGQDVSELVSHLVEQTNGDVFVDVDLKYAGSGEYSIAGLGGQTSGLTDEARIAVENWFLQRNGRLLV